MIYEYLCEMHGEFETTQTIKDEPLTICPKCLEEKIENAQPPKRLISKSSFVLKGARWASSGYS